MKNEKQTNAFHLPVYFENSAGRAAQGFLSFDGWKADPRCSLLQDLSKFRWQWVSCLRYVGTLNKEVAKECAVSRLSINVADPSGDSHHLLNQWQNPAGLEEPSWQCKVLLWRGDVQFRECDKCRADDACNGANSLFSYCVLNDILLHSQPALN